MRVSALALAVAVAVAAAVTATAAAVVSRAKAAASRGGKPGYVLQCGVGGFCGKARRAGQSAAGTGTGTGTGTATIRGSAPQEQVLGQAWGICLGVGVGGIDCGGAAAAPGSK